MILSIKQITKVLISLHGCTGWSVPLLFTHPEDRFLTSKPIQLTHSFEVSACENDVHQGKLLYDFLGCIFFFFFINLELKLVVDR